MRRLVKFLIGLSILLLVGNFILFAYNLYAISWGTALVIFVLANLGIAIVTSITLRLSRKLKPKDEIEV